MLTFKPLFSSKIFRRSPFALFFLLYSQRTLIYRLASRELLSRYKGSVLGLAWLFLVPLCQLVVYTIIFSEIFKARWDVELTSHYDFALILFLGLVLFNIFGEVLSRSPTLLIENVSYIKRVVFPLEIIPAVAVITALSNALISLFILSIFFWFVRGTFSGYLLVLPIYFVPCAFLSWGVALVLSSLGVYLRDLKPIVSLLTMMLLFMSPIFYPLSAVPEGLRFLLSINPVTLLIEDARSVLFKDAQPDIIMLAKQFLGSWIFAWLSLLWFFKSKGGFADVV